MTLYSKVTLTRTRVLLDTADVGAITTALVTGMPVPVPMDATDSCTPHYLAHECVFEQFILRDYARFPVLDQDRVVADHDMISAAFFLSGVQDTYLDFVTIVYDGVVTHAAATVWRAGRGDTFCANDAVYFGRGFIDSVFFTSTKAAPVTRDVLPGEAIPEPDDTDLARAVFDPEFVTGPLRVPFSRFHETVAVFTAHGPDIDDRVWDEPMPRYGTDIAFDAAHPGAIIAEYHLIRLTKDEP